MSFLQCSIFQDTFLGERLLFLGILLGPTKKTTELFCFLSQTRLAPLQVSKYFKEANMFLVILPNTSGYNSKESIYCNAQYGPTFGQGHDIYIGENLQNCYTNFLYSFSHPTIPASNYTKPEGKTYFCGSHKFVPSDLEVFRITFDDS